MITLKQFESSECYQRKTKYSNTWTVPDLQNIARQLGIPFSKKSKKQLCDEITEKLIELDTKQK